MSTLLASRYVHSKSYHILQIYRAKDSGTATGTNHCSKVTVVIDDNVTLPTSLLLFSRWWMLIDRTSLFNYLLICLDTSLVQTGYKYDQTGKVLAHLVKRLQSWKVTSFSVYIFSFLIDSLCLSSQMVAKILIGFVFLASLLTFSHAFYRPPITGSMYQLSGKNHFFSTFKNMFSFAKDEEEDDICQKMAFKCLKCWKNAEQPYSSDNFRVYF